MELKQLEYYVELCRTRNFTKAVQKLEDELGVRLVDRSRKPLGLTAAGEKFCARVKAALRELDEAAEEAGAGAGKGPRRLPVLGMTTLSGAALKRMLTTPSLIPQGLVYNIIERSSVEICGRLVNKELDLGWVFRRGVPEELEFIPVETQEALLLLPPGHPLSTKREITFGDLRDEPFAMMTTGEKAALVQIVLEKCAEAGFEPKNNIVIQSFHPDANMAVECVRAGYGISFMPQHAAAGVTGVPVLSMTPPLTFEVGLAYRKGVRLSAEARRLKDFILDEYPRFISESSD